MLVSDDQVDVSEEDKDGKVSWKFLKDLNNENTHIIIHPILELLKKKFL